MLSHFLQFHDLVTHSVASNRVLRRERQAARRELGAERCPELAAAPSGHPEGVYRPWFKLSAALRNPAWNPGGPKKADQKRGGRPGPSMDTLGPSHQAGESERKD